jgi:hypothetical protein
MLLPIQLSLHISLHFCSTLTTPRSSSSDTRLTVGATIQRSSWWEVFPLSRLSLYPTGSNQIRSYCLFGATVLEPTYFTIIAIVISGDCFDQLLSQCLLIQRKISFLPSVQCGRSSCIFVLLPYRNHSASNGILLIPRPCHRVIVAASPIGVPCSRSNRDNQLLSTPAQIFEILVYTLVSQPICFVKHPQPSCE